MEKTAGRGLQYRKAKSMEKQIKVVASVVGILTGIVTLLKFLGIASVREASFFFWFGLVGLGGYLALTYMGFQFESKNWALNLSFGLLGSFLIIIWMISILADESMSFGNIYGTKALAILLIVIVPYAAREVVGLFRPDA